MLAAQKGNFHLKKINGSSTVELKFIENSNWTRTRPKVDPILGIQT